LHRVNRAAVRLRRVNRATVRLHRVNRATVRLHRVNRATVRLRRQVNRGTVCLFIMTTVEKDHTIHAKKKFQQTPAG
jgi:hypothetical protein